MVAMEPRARRYVAQERRVFLFVADVGALGEVGAKRALAPGLGARPLHGQPLVAPVQVVDDVVVVVVLVVVQVVVLEESGPATRRRSLLLNHDKLNKHLRPIREMFTYIFSVEVEGYISTTNFTKSI